MPVLTDTRYRAAYRRFWSETSFQIVLGGSDRAAVEAELVRFERAAKDRDIEHISRIKIIARNGEAFSQENQLWFCLWEANTQTVGRPWTVLVISRSETDVAEPARGPLVVSHLRRGTNRTADRQWLERAEETAGRRALSKEEIVAVAGFISW